MALKKTTSKLPPKPPRSSAKVSSNVKVVPGKMSPTSVRSSSVNEKLMSGADQARLQNEKKMAEKAKALKAANKPTNKTGSSMNKLERDFYKKLTPAEQKKLLKSLQDTERAGLSKTTRNTVRGRGGLSGARVGGLGGGMNWQNK